MRKLIAAINMTLDGICNHDGIDPDEDLHQHYNDLLKNAGALLYGRTTYQLMENYWPAIVKSPTGNKAVDEFAILMDNIPKIVFSTTLEKLKWNNSTILLSIDKEALLKLKKLPGKDLVAGSPSLINALFNNGLIDEFQICIHPVLLGKGMLLFSDIQNKINLRLNGTKTFASGAVILTYNVEKQKFY